MTTPQDWVDQDWDPTTWTSTTWPIAACLHGFAQVTRDGTAFHDAAAEVWDEVFAQIEAVGFSLAELADSHIRPADLEASRRDELFAVAKSHGIGIPSVHLQRKSVIQPGHEDENLAYAHRTIDAAAEWGMQVFSTGLHQPFTDAQKRALWFWTAPGPKDPDDPEVWNAAVKRLREARRARCERRTADGTRAVRGHVPRHRRQCGPPGRGDRARQRRAERGRREPHPSAPSGRGLAELFAKTMPYTNYLHVKNYTRDEAGDGSWATSAPSTMETGLINYRQVLRDAVADGFRGIVMTEQYGGDSLGVCATNQQYIRSVLATTKLDATATPTASTSTEGAIR
ncbi:sugar phosphate isomerase/epimerase [Curtobacterium flaccumfaciens]